GEESWIGSVNSYSPVYSGANIPWKVGIIHDDDTRLALQLIKAREAVPGVKVGGNVPYTHADRVYFTLERHARTRNLPCAMIGIRNDQVAEAAGQRKWAELLATLLAEIRIEETA